MSYVEQGPPCPRCGHPTEVRKHFSISAKLLLGLDPSNPRVSRPSCPKKRSPQRLRDRKREGGK
jgi:hypothetical protein